MDNLKTLIKYSRLIAGNNLVCGASGNISIRTGKKMLIKASGCFMEEAAKGDFLEVDIKTLRFKQKSAHPSCEFKMHAFCYENRPDINAVIHTHPLYATTLINCSIKPQLLGPESAINISSGIGIVEYICPGTQKLASRVSRCIKSKDIVYLKNHGLLSVGTNLKQAYARTILAEQMAKMQLMALAIGKKLKGISKKEIKQLLQSVAR